MTFLAKGTQLLSWANGKKTYATVAIGLGVGIAQGFGVHIPMWVDAVLGFAGLGFHRSALTAQAQVTTTDAIALVRDILSQITVQAAAPVVVVPSPANQTPAQEQAETADLNKAQLAK